MILSLFIHFLYDIIGLQKKIKLLVTFIRFDMIYDIKHKIITNQFMIIKMKLKVYVMTRQVDLVTYLLFYL